MDVKFVEITEEDLELIRKWRNSESVSQYMYTSNQISEDQQKIWFERIKNDSSQKYWIIEYGNIKLGLVSLYNIRRDFKHCYWAFYLGNTELRGAGIGSKVEYKVIEYVFEEMNFNRLMCEVFSFNKKVIEMHLKFGFIKEGYYREHIFKNNILYDVVALALLRKDWNKIKGELKEKIHKKIG